MADIFLVDIFSLRNFLSTDLNRMEQKIKIVFAFAFAVLAIHLFSINFVLGDEAVKECTGYTYIAYTNGAQDFPDCGCHLNKCWREFGKSRKGFNWCYTKVNGTQRNCSSDSDCKFCFDCIDIGEQEKKPHGKDSWIDFADSSKFNKSHTCRL